MIGYVFKLNVGPSVLEAFSEDMTKLVGTVIPNDLKKIFDFQKVEDKLMFFKFKDEYEQITNSNEYKEMLEKNKHSKKCLNPFMRSIVMMVKSCIPMSI